MENIKEQLAQENPHALTEPPLATFTCENTTPHPRLQWAKLSVPFSKGAMLNEAALNEYGVLGGFFEWKVLKWHFEQGAKHSIAIAQLKFVAYFTGPGITQVQIIKTKRNDLAFTLHANIESYLNELFLSVVAKVKIQGDAKEYVAFPLNTENLKIISATASGITYRARTTIKSQTLTGLIPGKLSCTAFVEVNYQDPTIKTTVVFGNDILEAPQSGGVAIESIRFESSQRVILSPLMPAAYGISFMGDHFIDAVTSSNSFSLADGQTVAFRINAFVKANNEPVPESDWFYKTFKAECQEPLIPVMEYSYYKQAKALNLYQDMPPLRFTNKQQVKASFEAQYGAPHVAGSAVTHLGYLNLNPGATGSQPDFASTVPSIISGALQVQSQKVLNKLLLAVDRECLRPSYYFKTTNGYADRIKAQNYTNLFFWSSHPHYDFSWNNEYPEWQSRTGAFQKGTHAGGWNGHDNQHLSNNHLRTMYELTGDAYLGDICEYYISVIYFNFFTKWLGHTEAERCNRTMKEALMHACLFPDNADAQLLIEKIKHKMVHAFKNECVNQMAAYPAHAAAVAPFNSCDPRVMGGVHCVTSGNPNIVAVAWQTGFHMEFLNLMIELGFEQAQARELAQLYQNSINYYFEESGQKVTYFLLTNPTVKETQGIGVEWWAGWGNIAKHFPENPRTQALMADIKSMFNPAPNKPVGENESWNSF